MIDLHLHTTASDGLLPPAQVVARAAAAGLTVISVTDHDTLAGLAEASAAAARHGLRLVPGIEVTAVEDDQDVHVLGYFVDHASDALDAFLTEQRADRVRRVREMAVRLESLGFSIDVDVLLAAARQDRRSIGRPALADALVAAGYVSTRDDAFAELLGRGRPAFVPRRGASVADVIRVIHRARGLAALAHPGLLDRDASIPEYARAGLDALEVWHSDHPPGDVQKYAALAGRLSLARTGGSDFHGDAVHRGTRIGAALLPDQEFRALESRWTARA